MAMPVRRTFSKSPVPSSAAQRSSLGMTPYIFPSRFDPIVFHRGDLPHWRLEDVLYFVTFRLADSMPRAVLERWKRDRDVLLGESNAEIDWNRLLARERWLDRGDGSCALALSEVRALVEATLRYFSGVRYQLDEFVIAPNHVHVLVAPKEPWSLSQILQSWKGFAGREIVRRFGRQFPTLRARVWQRESFDHIVRNADSLEKFRAYIRAHDR